MGLPINSIVKPMLDFLLTLRSGRFGSSCLFVKLKKGGVAYGCWDFMDRDSIPSELELAGEVLWQVLVFGSMSGRI